MSQPFSPEDRPDPADQQAVRARVPEHVGRGVFSTGVIVMTAPTEFVLDFVQNLGRPHQIVARIVMPHPVLPQFVDALLKNIELYRARYGNLPQPNWNAGETAGQALGQAAVHPVQQAQAAQGSGTGAAHGAGPSGAGPTNAGNPLLGQGSGQTQPPPRRPSAQEIYDELKLRDELLSGAYANAVMIGHGAHEFSFDFITNFYPHSAVSCRVFLASGQIARLAESLRGAWEQIKHRFQPPGLGPTQYHDPGASGGNPFPPDHGPSNPDDRPSDPNRPHDGPGPIA